MAAPLRDLRLATRNLRRNPAFTAAAALTLALGIGATTAMFSVVDGVLLRPLPIEDEDRLLVVWKEDRQRDFPHIPFTRAGLQALGEQARLLEDPAGLVFTGSFRLVLHLEDGAVDVQGMSVTGNFFRTLGVRPAAGRLLRPEDDVAGAAPVAVLGHGAWRRLFGGDRTVVGRTLRLNETAYTIVGIAPEGFVYPAGAEVWVPLQAHFGATAFGRELLERHPILDVVGRIAPGATRAQAEAELDAVLERLAATDPAHRDHAVVARTLPEVVVGDVRPTLLILAGAVALVLFIAGVNVANLLLIRGIARQREFAVRAALGARRRQLLRPLLAESLVLAVAGGILGVLVSSWAVRGLVALAPPELPRLDGIGIDGRVLAFAAIVSLLSAALFGLLPALAAARRDLAAALRGGARAVGRRTARWSGREALVVGQVTLTVVVLVGAVLMLRSLERLQRLDLGFRADRLVLVDVVVPASRYPDAAASIALFDRIVERVEAIPGVSTATPVYTEPFSGEGGLDGRFLAEGQDPEDAERNPWVNLELAAPNYFETFGQPVLRGRAFTEADREGAPPVAIVNEALARRAWPGEDPIGKRLRSDREQWRTVVGLVADARYRALEEVRPSLYLPWRQGLPVGPGRLAVAVRPEAATVLAPFREAVRQVDAEVDVLSATPMDRLLAKPMARPRFASTLLGAFAGLGLALSAIGIYGVVAAFVRLRQREMGVRMALGANPGDVLRLVLMRGVALAAIGVALGCLAALGGARLLATILHDVRPTDPVALGSAAAVVLAIAVAASYVPALAATRVDPMRVLQSE